MHGSGSDVTSWQLLPSQLVAALGMGPALAPFCFDIALAGVADEEVGSASGVLNATQQRGSALGIAVVGTIFFTLVTGGVSGEAQHAAQALPASVKTDFVGCATTA